MRLATALSERPLQPLEAYRALDQWARDHGRSSLLLLLHTAVPNTIRPDLLNLIKLNFVPEARNDPTADADVLFCGFVEPMGADFYCLHPEVRRQCLDLLDGIFKSEPTLRTVRVAKLILSYIEHMEREPDYSDPLIRKYMEVERWVALAFIQPSEAARHFAEALKRSTESDRMVASLRFGGQRGRGEFKARLNRCVSREAALEADKRAIYVRRRFVRFHGPIVPKCFHVKHFCPVGAENLAWPHIFSGLWASRIARKFGVFGGACRRWATASFWRAQY